MTLVMKNKQSNGLLDPGRWMAVFLLAISSMGPLSAAGNMVTLQGHIPPQIRNASKMARVPATEVVPLSLAVRRDQNILDQTLSEMYGRNAPAQKHYLSSAEFAQRFGLTEKRQALKDFARANGLTVDPADDIPGSMMVKVSGPANVVEKTFHVELNRYRAADGRVFRAHDTEPVIPASLVPHLGAVMGLSNLAGILHPHLQMKSAASIQAQPSFTGATGPAGSLAPADIKAIYGLSSTTLTGTGQTVAVFEL